MRFCFQRQRQRLRSGQSVVVREGRDFGARRSAVGPPGPRGGPRSSSCSAHAATDVRIAAGASASHHHCSCHDCAKVVPARTQRKTPPRLSLGGVCAPRVSGRSERIRTSGPCVPNTVLYQAELHSVTASARGTAYSEAPAGGQVRGTSFRSSIIAAHGGPACPPAPPSLRSASASPACAPPRPADPADGRDTRAPPSAPSRTLRSALSPTPPRPWPSGTAPASGSRKA